MSQRYVVQRKSDGRYDSGIFMKYTSDIDKAEVYFANGLYIGDGDRKVAVNVTIEKVVR